jgi:hypothetical protein
MFHSKFVKFMRAGVLDIVAWACVAFMFGAWLTQQVVQ